MQLFKTIVSLFKSKETLEREAFTAQCESEKAQKFSDGFKAYLRGKELLEANQDAEALACFDKALENGYKEDKDLYIDRGIALQVLGWDLDAIDDFSKGIGIGSLDPNLYFMRGLSRSKVGDYEGALADLKQAIDVADKFRSTDTCKALDDYAREHGFQSNIQFYQGRIKLLPNYDRIGGRTLIEKYRLAARRRPTGVFTKNPAGVFKGSLDSEALR